VRAATAVCEAEVERSNRRMGGAAGSKPVDTRKLMCLASRQVEEAGEQVPVWQARWDLSTKAACLPQRVRKLNFCDESHGPPLSGRGIRCRGRCCCGWARQTPKHVVMFCPNFPSGARMLAAVAIANTLAQS
jgi:hypothetical protein